MKHNSKKKLDFSSKILMLIGLNIPYLNGRIQAKNKFQYKSQQPMF